MKLNHLIFLLFCIISSFSVCGRQHSPESIEIEQNILKTNRLYELDKEALPYDEVIRIASAIIQHRRYYESDIIGKVYVLLADIATNKGDLARAFQFAKDGLTLNPLKPSIKLNLLLKMAAGYFIKGKHQQIFKIAEQVIELAKENNEIKFLLLGFSYRSMAFALIGEHHNALIDLQQVEKLISENPRFAEQVELLEILASAHDYLGDHKTALTMHLKLLKLRFDLSKMHNVGKTYNNLANSYLSLGQLDDAYNAYWEAKKYAEKNAAPIRIAFAGLGIGKVLYLQGDYHGAYSALLQAEQLFKGQNLTKPYLSSLIALAKASLKTDRRSFAYKLLQQAEVLSENVELTFKQFELIDLLSTMYSYQGEYKKAHALLLRYNELRKSKKISAKASDLSQKKISKASDKSRDLMIKLAEKSELSANFTEKYQRQQMMIVGLILIIVLLLTFIASFWFKLRANRLNTAYHEVEKPVYYLASPSQTKNIYQLSYKKARKYEYPLTIVYLSVINWTELNFKFSKKIVQEVTKTLATLINEHVEEFDHAGVINEGEYLLLYPYQTCEEVEEKLAKLEEAIKVRFFANLGDFSVNIRYALDTPTFQDIDPYIFLSRLSDTINVD